MSYLSRIQTRIKQANNDFRSALQITDPITAGLGLVFHLTGQAGNLYYPRLQKSLYERFMQPLGYQEEEQVEPPCNDGPIWVMWWQGIEDTTPDVIHACIESIRRHDSGRDVIIIEQHNYGQYVQIDPAVIDKFKAGHITIATFSDIMRFALLYQHGGIWIDATVYLTGDIPQEITQYAFYSATAHHRNPTTHWTSYFLAAQQGNPLCKLMYESLSVMSLAVEKNPEYFATDVFMMAAYCHYPQVRQMIDVVPRNNTHRFALSEQLNNPIETVHLDPTNYINKLTYKISYKQTTGADTPTVYSAVLNGKL